MAKCLPHTHMLEVELTN